MTAAQYEAGLEANPGESAQAVQIGPVAAGPARAHPESGERQGRRGLGHPDAGEQDPSAGGQEGRSHRSDADYDQPFAAGRRGGILA